MARKKQTSPAANQEPPARKPWVAVLDDERILRGFREVEAVAAGEVEVPPDCDLAPDGQYRWDGASFVPVKLARLGSAPADAVASALIAIRDKGLVDFPADTLAWLAQVERARKV